MRPAHAIGILIWIGTSVFATGPLGWRSGVTEDHFDLVEVCHMHNEYGIPKFDQLIWYDWDPQSQLHKVQAWRLMKNCRDCSDEEARELFEKQVEQYISSQPLDQHQSIRRACQYKGVFVGGPMMPQLHRGKHRSLWHDGDRLRSVTADNFRETWTQVDPERLNRDYYPEVTRKGLSQP